MKHLFLCTQARTGSSLLLHLLQLGPIENHFSTLDESIFNLEAFQYPQYAQLKNLLGDRLNKYCVSHQCDPDRNFDPPFFKQFIAEYFQRFSHGNMVTVKWFPWGMAKFLRTLANRGIEITPATLPEFFGDIAYIYLYREDLVRQTISRYIARRTKQWWSNIEAQTELTPETIPYDLGELMETYQEFLHTEFIWNKRFQEFGVEPLYRFSYEELEGNYRDILQTLSDKLKVKINLPEPGEIVLQKQTGELNEYLCERFLNDLKKPVQSP